MTTWVFGQASGERNPIPGHGLPYLSATDDTLGSTALSRTWQPWQPGLPMWSPDGKSPLMITFSGSPATLRLAGEIDESNYPDLIRVLSATATAEAGGRRLDVDMTDVAYCDLAGLRALVSLAVPGVRHVVLRQLAEPLRAALRILGWDATPGLSVAGPPPG